MKAPLSKDWRYFLDKLRAAVPDPQRSEVSNALRKALRLDESLDPLDPKNWPVPVHGLHRPTDKVLQLPIVLVADSAAQKAMFMLPVTIAESIPAGTAIIGNVGLEAGVNSIGTVGLDAGVNVIGNVGLEIGLNSIGTVGLDAGVNSIGTVGLNAGANSIGMVGLDAGINEIGGVIIVGNRCITLSGVYAEGDPYYNIITNLAAQVANLILITTDFPGLPSPNFHSAIGNLVKVTASSSNFLVNFYLDTNTGVRVTPTIYMNRNTCIEIGCENLVLKNFGRGPQPTQIRITTSAFGVGDFLSVMLQGYVD